MYSNLPVLHHVVTVQDLVMCATLQEHKHAQEQTAQHIHSHAQELQTEQPVLVEHALAEVV